MSPVGGSTRRPRQVVADRFHEEHRQLYGYDFRDDSRQEVEWVNIRVTGVGPIRKPELRAVEAGRGADERRDRTSPGLLRRLGRGAAVRPGEARCG